MVERLIIIPDVSNLGGFFWCSVSIFKRCFNDQVALSGANQMDLCRVCLCMFRVYANLLREKQNNIAL